MLMCPVRECRKPLIRVERTVLCDQRHSFDVSRSGYINLLQPQDRRSRQPGDTIAAVQGRRRLHDSGMTRPLLDAIAEMVKPQPEDIVLDVGCGDGFYLGSLQQQTGFSGYGLDISTASIDAAARRYPQCEWVVANADRFIPYTDQSFSLVLSITARMNSAEFRRVLREDGRLLIAIPSPSDLVELRGSGRDRVERTVETFAPEFSLVQQKRVTTTADLDAEMVEGVAASIYRPQSSEKIQPMQVTFSLDLLLFEAKKTLPK